MLITFAAMASATMVAVDITICNVALPHMQSTMQASSDQITWVLTSYLICAAIATPLSSWLAGRFGRKRVMTFSVAGFTLASLLCGMANDLSLMIAARALQGAFGASLIPLSQATLLDINPPERHAKAMGVFAMGSMLGPLIGPTAGGWLTDSFSWRYVFLVNLPIGTVSLLLMTLFLGDTQPTRQRFDAFGFATVSIALASFQLMLDRGEQGDWFESTEIQIYATAMFVALYLAVVHMFTAKDTFIRPALFGDRNFTIGCTLGSLVGMVTFATLPIITVMMQAIYGYSALRTGLVSAPRGIGTVLAMLAIARLPVDFDRRYLLAGGLLTMALAQYTYSGLDLYADQNALLAVGLIHGIGAGLIFLPMTMIVFATLPAQLRNEGTALFALSRNLGQSLGISYLQYELIHRTAASHGYLIESVRPDNPIVEYALPDIDFSSGQALARLSGEVARQADMVGHVSVFSLLAALSLLMLPLVLFLRVVPQKQREALPVME